MPLLMWTQTERWELFSKLKTLYIFVELMNIEDVLIQIE